MQSTIGSGKLRFIGVAKMTAPFFDCEKMIKHRHSSIQVGRLGISRRVTAGFLFYDAFHPSHLVIGATWEAHKIQRKS